MTLSHAGKRLAASAFLGVFLASTLVPPARAIIPAAAVVGGVVVRGVTGSLLRKAGVSGVGSGAQALSASGLFGVSAAAYIVICGQNALAGQDCSGTPLAKIRPQGVNNDEGETLAATQAGTPTYMRYSWTTNYGSGTAASWSAARTAARANWCAANPSHCASYPTICWNPTQFYGSGSCTETIPAEPTTTGQTASVALNSLQNGNWYNLTTWSTASKETAVQGYTCPAGYTWNGTNCTPSYAWNADGAPSYRNNGGVIIADPKDPDVGPAPAPSPQTIDGVQPNGQPIRVKIEALPDGGVKVTTYGQGTSNGATSTTVNEFQISSGGTPTAITNIYLGDINTVAGQAAPTTQTPAPTPVEIPTDYARENTLQSVQQEAAKAATELKKMNDEGLKVKEEGTPEGKSQAQTDTEGRIGRGGAGGGTTGSVYPDDENIGKLIAPSSDLTNKRSSTDNKVSNAFNLAESCQDISFGEHFTLAICGSQGAEWLRLALAWVYGMGGVVYLYRRSGDVLAGDA